MAFDHLLGQQAQLIRTQLNRSTAADKGNFVAANQFAHHAGGVSDFGNAKHAGGFLKRNGLREKH